MLSDDEDVEVKRLMLLLFIIPVLGSFLLRLYVVWQYSDAGAVAFLFLLVVLALAITSFCIGKRSILFGAGLLVLTIAFWLTMTSFIVIGEEWRLVEMLKYDPNAYTNLVNSTLYYNILPTAVGLLLCTIGSVMQRKKLDMFGNLLLLIVGFFFAVWGIHYVQATIENYIEAINTALQSDAAFLEETLETIYTLYKIIGILWLAIGIFLAALSTPPIHRFLKLRKKIAKANGDTDLD